jgi:hypothetical protein
VTRSGTISDFVIRGDRNLYAYAQGSPGGSFPSPQKLTATGNLTGIPAAVLGANGAISVYARTTAGSVKAIWQSAAGGAFSNSASLGGSITGDPAAIITHNGTVALYATGTNGQLYTWTQATPGGPFSAPTRLTSNGGLTGTPVAAVNGSGMITVFDRTGGRTVRAKWQSAPGGAFTGNANLGGSIAGGMAALAAGNDTISLYATGTDGRQYGDLQVSPGGAYSGWAVI